MTEGVQTVAPGRPEPGAPVTFRWVKWDGGVHWEHECIYLGSDEWGDWVGQLPGARGHRPGRDVVVAEPNVCLIPPDGEWVLTMNAPPNRTRVYIDLAWRAGWRDGEPVGIDMDLDVVDREGVGVWIDDRDEWDEHRVSYGYPHDVVARLEAVALDLERRVSAHEPPFDPGTATRWLHRLAGLADMPPPAG